MQRGEIYGFAGLQYVEGQLGPLDVDQTRFGNVESVRKPQSTLRKSLETVKQDENVGFQVVDVLHILHVCDLIGGIFASDLVDLGL